MIKKLGDDEVKFNLALSLHAANDKKRDHIMAINETNNLEALADALRYFYGKTGTRVTYEYIIFKDFNDELEDAQERSEEHTSELQSRPHLVCRLLLEK